MLGMMGMLKRLLLVALVAWSAFCHAQMIGGKQTYPGDAFGANVAIFSTKAVTTAWLSGTKPAFDVVVYDGAGVQIGGTTTLNFVNGVFDVATATALLGAQQLGSPVGLPITGNWQHTVFIIKWYDQGGNANDAVAVPGDGVDNWPVLRIFGQKITVGFGNNDLSGEDFRRLALPNTVALSSRATTVLAVASAFTTNRGSGNANIFYSSNDGTSGIGIVGATDGSNDLNLPRSVSWRTHLLNAGDQAIVPVHTDMQPLTLSSGPSGGELGNDYGTAAFGVIASTTGTGFVIGCASVAPGDNSCHHGDIVMLAIKAAYSTPAVTADMRATAAAFFGLSLDQTIPNVAIDGDSGTYGMANYWPAISGSNQGSEGYGPTQQIPAGLKKYVRMNNIARGGSNFASGTTNSIIDRAPRMRALYRSQASINIAAAFPGATPPAPGAPTTAQVNDIVTWVTALRSTGQTWTIFVGNQGGSSTCATADGINFAAALAVAAAANNFTVIANNSLETVIPCLSAYYGQTNIFSPAPVSHVYAFGIGLNVADLIAKMNAVLP